jgi:outer membrane lipoprotein-sorting protein
MPPATDHKPRNRHSAGLTPGRIFMGHRHGRNQSLTDLSNRRPRRANAIAGAIAGAALFAATIAGAVLPAAEAAAAPPPRSLAPPPVTAGQQAIPTPIIPDPRKRQPANIFATFSPDERALIGRIGKYLSAVQTMMGNFVQVGPDGGRTTGDFYMQKPGKIRFEYDDPSPIAIVADGTSVVVRDRKLATQDVYPLSQTPLRFLLSNNIDLLRDTNVVSVSADDLYISVTIEEKHALAGTSRLMLMLDAKDNLLKQWTVTDQQGYDTTVAVYNVDTSTKLDPAIFKIDYTNYATPQQ